MFPEVAEVTSSVSMVEHLCAGLKCVRKVRFKLWKHQLQFLMEAVVPWPLRAPPSASLDTAGAVDALAFGRGVEQGGGLGVHQAPEVLEGDVLSTLHTHLLHEFPQRILALQALAECGHLVTEQGLELSAVHGGLVVSCLVELRHQSVQGQLQVRVLRRHLEKAG